MAERCVDRVNQIEARIDEGAVQVEDQKTNPVGIERAEKTNHVS